MPLHAKIFNSKLWPSSQSQRPSPKFKISLSSPHPEAVLPPSEYPERCLYPFAFHRTHHFPASAKVIDNLVFLIPPPGGDSSSFLSTPLETAKTELGVQNPQMFGAYKNECVWPHFRTPSVPKQRKEEAQRHKLFRAEIKNLACRSQKGKKEDKFYSEDWVLGSVSF